MLAIDFGQDMIMMLKPAGGGQVVSTTLFEIVNQKELLDHPQFNTVLSSWIALQDLPEQTKPTGQGFLYEDYAEAIREMAAEASARNKKGKRGSV